MNRGLMMIRDAANQWMKQLWIIDRTNQLHEDALNAFALDELLCNSAYQTGHSYCHIWRNSAAFVLGHKDARLPKAEQAVEWLRQQGYNTFVRNSGGAAVPLDKDVVNISLIFPKLNDEQHFHADFESMYQFVSQALHFTGATINKGEIQGAYCPGDYDLSIAGKKFCGIAQRRKLNAFIIQAFIVVDGSGAKRAELVREFYHLAAAGDAKTNHPIVTSSSTASIAELTHIGEDATRVFIEQIMQLIGAERKITNGMDYAMKSSLPTPQEIVRLANELRHKYTQV